MTMITSAADEARTREAIVAVAVLVAMALGGLLLVRRAPARR